MIKKIFEMAKKAAAKVVKAPSEAATEVVDVVVDTKPERDEAFYKAHKGAREDVIYG